MSEQSVQEGRSDRSLPGRLALLEQVADSLPGVAQAPLWPCTTEQVGDVLTVIGRVRQQLDVLERRAMAEAIERGLPADAGYSPVDWLCRALGGRAPDPSVHHAASVVRLSRAQLDGELADVIQRMDDGDLGGGAADQILRFHAESKPVADPQSLAEITSALVDAASDAVVRERPPAGEDPDSGVAEAEGSRGNEGQGGYVEVSRSSGLSHRRLARYLARARQAVLPAADLARDEESWRAGRMLFVRPGVAGMSEYRWLLDPEGAAVVDAALAVLAAPVKEADGSPDRRSPARRRADALLDLVARGVACPEDAMPTHQAQVVVTMDYERLLEALRGVGVTATGHVLSPETVRRIACDAGVTPMLLGTDGAPLDVGRTQRLFTPSQRKALWQRDQGCTFPGCTAPPAWTEAHHVIHWIHGGPTDLLNGALLCRRHHSTVHSRGLTATVTASSVTWHT